MEGYEEANKIDRKIHVLLKEYPIKLNLTEWAKLTRTVKTSILLIESIITEERRQELAEERK